MTKQDKKSRRRSGLSFGKKKGQKKRSSIGRKKTRPNKKKVIFTKPILGLDSYLRKSSKKQPKLKKKLSPKSTPKIKLLNFKHINQSAFYSFFKTHPKSVIFSLALITTFGSLTYIYILKDLPHPTMLANTKPPMTTIIRDRHGIVLYRVYNNANRVELEFSEIPDIVKNSTIAIEDANFYSHLGIDLKGIVRAVINNIQEKNSDYFQGGSTITQQLVKNRFFNAEKTYERKIKEAITAVWTEAIYSKEDILAMYLNTVGYGGPAYGIEAASQMYFNKATIDLTLAEAAYLAGLPASPTRFSPYGVNPELAKIRQQQILERMLKLNMVTQDEYLKAVNEKLAIAPQKINILAPHFVMYIKEELVKRFGEKAVEEGGFDVTTTLDLNIHNKVQEIARKNIESIKDKYRISNTGVLVTNTATAEILAMVGSVDYFDGANSGHYNATTALRQPGSAFKPITYGFAFDHGFTPTTTILDAPVIYKTPGSKEIYAPVNYDSRFHGNVTIRSALANSYNIPAVKTLEKFGVENVKKFAIDLGLESLEETEHVGLSLTLGGAEVTMLEMAKAYGTIANLGVKKELKPILSIKDVNSQDLTAQFYDEAGKNFASQVMAQDNVPQDAKEDRVLSPLAAYWLTDIMSDNIARMPAFGRNSKLSLPDHKIAVKTGTSNNFRDNWTIGYTPDYLTAVWVGNNDGSFMNRNLVSGITGAAPIWNEVMQLLLEDKKPKEFPVPEGLIAVKVCALNGLLMCAGCPSEKTEYFTADKVPTKKCSFRPKAECDAIRAQAIAENKSEDEKKALLSGCAFVN